MNTLTFLRTPLAWLIAALLAVALAACGGGGGSSVTGASSPPTVPAATVVTSTSPTNAATGVGVNTKVTASFNRAMNATTISASTFTLAAGSAAVAGTVSLDATNNIATFTPTAALSANTVYTATLTTAVMDSSGNALAANYTWTFTTAAGADITAPTVSSTSPAGLSINVAINSRITATFTEAMDASTINGATFTVTKTGSGPVSGTVSYSGSTAVFTPSANLATASLYSATITTAAKDLAGNALGNGSFTWTFMTGSSSDTTPPTVTSTSIPNGAIGVGLNVKVSAFFSEAMDPTTINTSSFIVMQGNTQVAGSVTYIGGVATFIPIAPLAASTAYTATISTAVKDQAGNAMASAYVFSWTTGTAAQAVTPSVSSTDPAAGSVNVALNKQISVTFNEAMDPTTITAANFTLQGPGSAAVLGTVSYSGATATFTPIASLATNTQYTATIGAGVRDLSGNGPSGSFSWTFTTGATSDVTLPSVRATDPVNQAVGVATNKVIAITFSEAMNASTLNNASITLTGPGNNAVSGSVNSAGNVAVFTPNAALLANTTFTATVNTSVRDLAGNAMAAAYTWSFTTGASADTTPPSVTSTLPGNGATGVTLNQTISITFNEAMDATTITTATIGVTGPGNTAVAGTVVYYSGTNLAAFTPNANLAASTIYTVTVSTGVKDLRGNAMLAAKVWSFTTGLTTGGIAAVNLRSLTSFAVVAGGGLVNANASGQTTINGNVGLSPTATCLGDGSPCSASDPVINGTLFANDAGGVAAQAKADLALAYADAAGRVAGAPKVELGGTTLVPGVYTSATAMQISSGGTLTLDAQGDPNATWIFQVATSLTVTNNAQVVLINGAKAANVFWAVAGSTTLGSTSNFSGVVMSGVSNTVNTGATVSGRLFCTTGQVSLTSDTVFMPGP